MYKYTTMTNNRQPIPLREVVTELSRFQWKMNRETLLIIFDSEYYANKYFIDCKENLLDFFEALDTTNKKKLLKYFSDMYESLV